VNHKRQQVSLTLAGLWFLLAAGSASGQTYITTVSTGTYTAAYAAAVNLATNKVYVANSAGSNAGSVTVINGADNSFANFADSSATNPKAVAVNPVTNKIYVANNGSKNVTVIDGSTDTVKTTVTVGNAPIDVAVNPQTNKIYVANITDGTVSVIDGSSDTVTGTVTVGSAPKALAVNPVTNLVYVANSGSTNGTNYVSVINASNNNAVTQISDSNGSGPTAVAVNPVTNTAYVANSGSSYVTVIKGTAAAASSDIQLLYAQVSLAVNPVTNQIFVTCGNNNAIYIINGNTSATSFIQPDSSNNFTAVAVDPMNNMMYATDIAPSDNPLTVVTVVSGATNQIVATISDTHASFPDAVAINPVTNKIYVPNANSFNVTVIDGASYQDTTVSDASAQFPAAVAVNPATNTAYVANGNNTVTVITGTTTANVTVGTTPVAVAVNPVTNLVYVANQGSNNVSVINGTTQEVTATISDPNANSPQAIAVNPVTNTVYVSNGVSNNVSVFNGTTYVTTLTDPNANSPYAIAVNPVTNTIYVANYGDGATSSTVSVFAGDTNVLIATPGVGIGPTALVVNPVTNMIYVANYYGNGSTDNGDVSVINGATNKVVATVADPGAVNPTAVDVNPFTDKIYVANSSGSGDFPSAVTVINGADNTYISIDDPYACVPYAVAVNPVSNKIYVVNNCADYPYGDGFTGTPVTVIDGSTNASTSLGYAVIDSAVAGPVALAVNPATNTVYVADGGSLDATDEVIVEQQVQAIPITTTINPPLTNDQTSSFTPAFNFTTSNSFTPPAPIDNLLFQVGTWESPWLVANQGNGSFTGSIPTAQPLQVGFHFLYAFASDGEEATSTNTGLGTGPLIGNITAYPFLVGAPEAGFSPGSLTFLGVTGSGIPIDTTTPEQSVKLTNYGSVPLTVTAVGLSDPSDFAETDACANSSPIAPGNYCTIDVTFTPRALGSLPATLTVTDNSGDVPGTVHQIALTGTAIQATSTTKVTPSVASSVFGQSVTFTATVTPNTPLAPTGTVTFADGTNVVCSAVPLTSGQATCTTAALAVATHSISASYAGNTYFTASNSLAAPLSFVVGKASTSTAITSTSPSAPMIGQAITVNYTVTVNAPGAGTIPASDTVTVTDGTGASCTATVAAGKCALTPTVLGTDSLTASYGGDANFAKSSGSTPASFTVAQTVNLTGLTATVTPDQSTSVSVALGSPATEQLSGTLTLSFTSNAAGTSTGYIDPNTCFVNASGQCVTQLTFTLPVGATTASLPNNGMIQQGTTAGTIIVTLTSLTAGGVSVLPTPAPSGSVVVPTISPVLKSVSIVNKTSSGFSVQITAYSTPRDLANATFVFTAASGTDLNGSSPPAVALSSTAQPYFASENGALGGGTFVLTVPFSFTGDISSLGSVAVTLSNSVGTSSSMTGQ
jgi:YVTN family beta-propeller protein